MIHKFLSGLKQEYEQITGMQIGRLDPGLTKNEVVMVCRKRVLRLSRMRRNVKNKFYDSLYPMLSDDYIINEEDEQGLYDAAQTLSSYETRLDAGLALTIYQKLLDWSRGIKDDARIVKYLYWCGITLFFLRKDESEKIYGYFSEGASYSKHYDSFADPEARKYIHRCLGNSHMVLLLHLNKPDEAEKLENYNYSFWNMLIFTGKDLEFPWLNYFLTCLTHKHLYISKGAHTDPDSESKESLKKLLDTSITINKLYKKNIGSFNVFGGARYEFMLWEAQFLYGLISFDQLRENIERAKSGVEEGDYSHNALYIKVQLDCYLMFYASKMQKLKNKKNEIIFDATNEVIHYLSQVPMSVSPRDISAHLQLLISNMSEILDPSSHLDFVLKMTTLRHIPTYAHSIMVGKIASYLTKHIIYKNPGCFVGCLDITMTEEVIEKAEKLCEFAVTSGLCHDLGKISYISNPYMITRVLTDDEFEMVKKHPEDGNKMLIRDNGLTLFGDFSDIILGHHKYYNNQGGYPENFDISKSKYKMIIHILSVADSIDAATDDIGKMYSSPKELNDVLNEIIEESGSRYSPIVADVLKNKKVKTELKNILENDRPNAYYTAYLQAWS